MSGTPALAASAQAERETQARPCAPLVVFDFDHTLYDGDSGGHLVLWLIRRRWWRAALALLLSPLLLPLIAWLPTRRRAISAYLWIGTVGVHRRRDMDALIDRYVQANAARLRARLLPAALKVLQRHRDAGDRVIIATGAPPELARAILDFVAHEDLPVIGSVGAPFLGGMVTVEHCHHRNKMRMIRDAGYGQIAVAYSDSSADLPLLLAARQPVVVNPKPGRVAMFRRALPPGTPILNWGCRDRGGDPVA
ncbi:haloacid dehalogenase-like hydrolase [Vulcaniibacterium tengchongense]|uniref:Phosphatidylglycerophosphatase C n=1 Tax=Vulcaniibacterium tengchongense TaxID=1273429 RepID=A0A3N4VRD1_9GAMM|nr:haloacid dehalogenase-like hydrolase [Vulcaniibacterium tengchongense]RPE79617.1 phosphatidylglycerophosphatase C [Vulcaniibacterium tengchongense]